MNKLVATQSVALSPKFAITTRSKTLIFARAKRPIFIEMLAWDREPGDECKVGTLIVIGGNPAYAAPQRV